MAVSSNTDTGVELMTTEDSYYIPTRMNTESVPITDEFGRPKFGLSRADEVTYEQQESHHSHLSSSAYHPIEGEIRRGDVGISGHVIY
jgi:hypothetical protein